MRVFYYQFTDGKTYLVCVRGGDATQSSPIWNGCNTCSWLVPGTFDADR